MIIAYRKMGMAYEKIATHITTEEKFPISDRTCSNIWKRYQNQDLTSNRNNCGRHSAMEVEEKQEIIKAAESNPILTCKLIAEDENLNPHCTSRQTINRVLNEGGLKSYRPIKTFFISEENRQKRIKFAEKNLWLTDKWKSVVFSDESWFYVDDFRIRHVWLYPGEEIPEEFSNHFSKSKNFKKIMIWAAISYQGDRVMQFIEGSFDSAKYLKILKKKIPLIKRFMAGKKMDLSARQRKTSYSKGCDSISN